MPTKAVQIIIDTELPATIADADIATWIKYHLGLRGDIPRQNPLSGTEWDVLGNDEAGTIVKIKIDGKPVK